MPPITSPRRSAFPHGAPPHAHPAASRPIPGSGGPSSSSAASSPQRAAAHASLAAVAAAAASVSSSPSTGTSPNGLSTSPHPPYMVALAGWPEPVFVAEARDMWEKRKSRPGSPTGRMAPFGAMEVRDGLALPPPLAALDPSSGPYRGAMSRSQSSASEHRSRGGSPGAAPSPGRHAASPAFPTSSARDRSPETPPAEGEPLGPPPVPGARPRRLVGGFTDPRYGLNAAAVGRSANRAALRVAPAWHSASSTHAPPYAGTHGPVGAGRGGAGAGGRRTPGTMSPPAVPGHATSALRTQRAGAAAHRANPEVWPPPAAPAPHMATAVYPRDPDSPFVWQGLSAPASASASGAPSPANGDDEMDVDER
ncbi:hypothetical protein Q8F55_005174 [Vanrija albida]|uniref:Uncharacterized protein n=1 Tax=Vanrija albida TaxID=181172 RepID=A0ABR3Q0X1_9TREE